MRVPLRALVRKPCGTSAIVGIAEPGSMDETRAVDVRCTVSCGGQLH